ncbi:MAG TPA: 4a-hydroxytetrahydrobiopterin dehydratase [Tepidisphaeraceae bacterium]|jgi:4a-hydroxytetrahydrobiopterin dehydratase
MNNPSGDLAQRKCKPIEKGTPPLQREQITQALGQLPGWEHSPAGGGEISKTFHFKDYHHTMAFVNATAWISHREDHHPDLEVGFNKVKVRYSTHSIGGVSENDTICAAKIEAL